MFLKPTNLQQRTALYILAPTLIILLTLGTLGFRSIKSVLVEQLTLSATSHLQRTASYINSRLKRPKSLLDKMQTAPSNEIHEYLSEILQSQNGVIDVQYMNLEPGASQTHLPRDSTLVISNQSSLQSKSYYTPLLTDKTISLLAEHKNTDGRVVGITKVTISFYDLIGHIPGAPQWTGLHTFVIDEQGNILAPDKFSPAGEHIPEASSLLHDDVLRDKLISAILDNKSGAVFSDDIRYPDTIYGFHTLAEAPWTMVVASSGETILRPIITFQKTYFFFVILTTIIILILLRLLTARTIRAVREVSNAAAKLEKGYFGPPLQFDSPDELGELIRSFNSLTSQLEQGVQLKKAMEIAGEVQRNLLPKSQFKSAHLEGFGVSIPCDETGGDFYDLIESSEDDQRLTVVVGDVVGHGIGAALLMATTRALLRCRSRQPGTLADCITDVNALLCRDTEPAGNFVTVFMLTIEGTDNKISWVRAGHEPALVYNLKKNEFFELRGNGTALGLSDDLQYSENDITLTQDPHLILIGTDGVTDVENSNKEHFGKARVQSILSKWCNHSPEIILKTLCVEIETFRGNQHQNDDITFVIIKTH